MRKKYRLFLGIIVILFVIIFYIQRNYHESLEKSSYSVVNKDEKVKLLLESKDKYGLNCKIVNDTNNECTFNEICYMEKYEDSSWYKFAKIYNTLESAVIIPAKTDYSWNVPFESTDTIAVEAYNGADKITLKDGKYRLIFEVYENQNNQEIEHILSAEFSYSAGAITIPKIE